MPIANVSNLHEPLDFKEPRSRPLRTDTDIRRVHSRLVGFLARLVGFLLRLVGLLARLVGFLPRLVGFCCGC
jgi:hypothetical protein